MNPALIGYKKLKDCQGGELIRTINGTFAMVSQYGTDGRGYRDSYIYESGEALVSGNPEEWVAVINLGYVDVEFNEHKYPMDAIPQSRKDGE